MELIGLDEGASSRHLVKTVSLGVAICAAILVVIIIVQAISGAMLAAASRQDYQAADDARRQAISSFNSLATTHRIFGQLSLFPVLFLTALAIVFGIHASSVKAKNTLYKWLPGVLAVLLTIVLISIVYEGACFANFLTKHKCWLTPPAGGYPPDTNVAKEQVVTAARFSTFLATHGIVLPFLALILMIFLMPSFYEFVFEKRSGPRKVKKQKMLKLTKSQE